MNLKKFYQTVRKLKEITKSGWIERGVRDAESVSDHSFMTTVLCMVVPKKGIDKEKVIKMALIHDLAESEAGDLITKEHWEQGGTITKAKKFKMEEKSMKNIISNLPESEAKEILDLWKESEEGKTTEALFVRDIDVLEMIMQAYDYYRKNNFKKPLEGFWDEKNMSLIKDSDIKRIAQNLLEQGW